MSRLLQLRDNQIKEADDLCKKCGTNPEHMICDGVRLYKLVEATEFYSKIIYSTGTCAKFQYQQEKKRIETQFDASGLPESVVVNKNKLVKYSFSKLDGKVYVNGNPFPTKVKETYSKDRRDYLWNVGKSLIIDDIAFKYVSVPLWLSRFRDWATILTLLGDSVDVLYLDRFDMGATPVFVSEYMIELVYYRSNNNLATIITTNNPPRVRHDIENELYDEVSNWEPLKL